MDKLSPLIEWLVQEQADIAGKELAEVAGIAPNTWSRAKTGKLELSAELSWRVMKAIALLRPRSDAARVVEIIEGREGKKFSQPRLTIGEQLETLISTVDDSELEAVFRVLTTRVFAGLKESKDKSDQDRVKSPIPY